ncbi:MAG: hypothetical protein ACREP7_11770 [Lysobacter sp.]
MSALRLAAARIVVDAPRTIGRSNSRAEPMERYDAHRHRLIARHRGFG